MDYKRLKELSAAGFPVALAPEQLLRILQEREALTSNVMRVERTSDQSVTVAFSSCRAASEFERVLRDK